MSKPTPAQKEAAEYFRGIAKSMLHAANGYDRMARESEKGGMGVPAKLCDKWSKKDRARAEFLLSILPSEEEGG